MNIDFKKFNNRTELDLQRELFKECFPETIGTSKISEEHYLWKFQNKELGEKCSEYTANIEKDMVGYYAAIPYHYNYFNDKIKIGMVCDVMTGVKARGKGVFTQLGVYSTNELAKEGFDMSSGFPIRKEVIPGHIKAGWDIYVDLPLFGKILKFNSLLKQRKLGLFSGIANVLMYLYSKVLSILFLKKNKKISTDLSYGIENTDFVKLEEFYKSWAKNINIGLIKDETFLKWRLSAPNTEYQIFTLQENEKVIGVLISTKVIREGVPCLGILDISTLPEYRKYVSVLLRKTEEYAKQERIEMLLTMMSKYWFKNYKLAANSFFKLPFTFYLILKKFNKNLVEEELKDEKNWHLSWIDSDDL